MSTLSLDSLTSSTAAASQATEPAQIRSGGAKAKEAYTEGVDFEQMLTSELSQAMSATLSGSGSDSDGLGGTTDDSSGTSGSSSDSSSSDYGEMVSDALTTGLTSSGGLNSIAMEVARSLDPALNSPVGLSSSDAKTVSSGVSAASSATLKVLGAAS